MAISTLKSPTTKSRYTYDQFRQAAQQSGLLGEFSDADLSLAQRNPDAGMSLLSYKRDWHNATTDAGRQLANLGAESVRGSYGSYAGGADGGSFYLEPLSPDMFEYPEAPSFSGGSNAGTVSDLYDQMLNYGDFSYGPAPEYTNRWDDTILGLIDEILGREDFSYDPDTDPLYSQYRKAYIREGDRAAEDALGAAAAASGGLPSSYAQTAASQAGNYYAAQLTDKIPELQQLAYQKYLNDYNMLLSDLGVVQGQEASDYNKYLTDLNQYNTDRDFDYGAWLDRYNMLGNNLQAGLNMDAQELERYLAELQQYNTDRDFYYGQLLDEINDQTNDFGTLVDMAQLAAGYGDYRGLENLGIQLPTPSGYAGAGAGSSAGYDDEAGSPPGATDERISSEAMNILNAYMHVNPGTNSNVGQVFANRINSALSAGRISQEEADYLREMIGIAA